VYYTLSFTYVHLLVLVSHIIAQCTVMDHLKMRSTLFGPSDEVNIYVLTT
jgi:hypothetical protein